MQEQLNQIAEETGVPAELLERAARARATATGVDAEALVTGWAGGEAPAETAPAPAAAAPAAESGAGKLPEALVRRSAAAKAKREGRPLDEVLVEMGLSPEGATSETPAAPPAEATPAPAAAAPPAESGAGKLPEALVRRSAAAKAKREGRPLDEVLVEMGLSPEGETSEAPAASPAGAPASSAPAPAAATPAPEADEVEVVEEEPQPVFAGFPRWLAASFILIPMIALLYAGLAPNGPDCGTSGQLAINPVSGEAQSCGGGLSPFFSLGEAIYEAQCVACHGADGGGGVGPSFLGGAVLQTFSACEDHVEWVSIGTQEWPDATYGDTDKPAGGFGVMPGYQSSLTAQDIAAVSLYERVAFGGEDIAEAEVSCGLADPAEG